MTDGLNVKALPAKGVDEAIEVLTQVKADVTEELPKDARGIGRAVASDVQAAFPAGVSFYMPTLSGKNETLVEYDVNAVADVSDSADPVGSVGHEDEQVVLFRVVVTGTNATFVDMGQPHIQSEGVRVHALDYLDRTQGPASRFSWAVAHRAKGTTNNVLQRHSRRKESDYTKALAKPDE